MKKVLTAAVAALTIATAIAASTANVNAKPGGPGGFKAPGGGGGGGGGGAWMPPHKGGGWKGGKHLGYGFAAGIIGAAAYSAYYCDRVVPVFNRFGEFVGYRRTCDWY